ncbi:DUF726-domain-containing protein [Cutaneotrichosporon oleaginosum]|uniref:DUF726-domain-containing protein n=1 Tax=Cutaneotrichosporon oleaginosum TaxID=879819 RepID=A0A0J0XK63_9TREE|nr:DUF726-domain-containing protein [Cutaneotrichosporon oleaginosum]KLT41481.1 DUF726-domain-containing protein [Cutaneotrichosporon oleaginosum]TXT05868.1 hypothetical protein COLE_07188 [Cutaneotrichosporon oleaginosum]
MLPAPRAHNVAPPPKASTSGWADDLDDDDGWQDMPVVRSDDFTSDLDAIDDKRYGFRPPARLDVDEKEAAGVSNATGVRLELEPDQITTDSWREKAGVDEGEYTRLRLDEDNESEEVHMRTRYLFDEDKAMTPLSQMQATKELLTEGQRIAYVGLCQLIARRMVRDMGRGWEGTKEKARQAKMWKGKGRPHDVPVVESGSLWMLKIMARLYQHMELSPDEQRMIESLAEHGVDPADLVPALMATHTVKNPEFDPEAKRRADLKIEEDCLAAVPEEQEDDDPAPPYEEAVKTPPAHQPASPSPLPSPSHELPTSPIQQPRASTSTIRPMPSLFDDEGEVTSVPATKPPPRSTSLRPMPSLFDDDGDIGASSSPSPLPRSVEDEGDIAGDMHSASRSPRLSSDSPGLLEPRRSSDGRRSSEGRRSTDSRRSSAEHRRNTEAPTEQPEPPSKAVETTPKPEQAPLDGGEDFQAMPALPGVSTSLTAADEMVTLDIRWTVLCDLFLVLIADSVYDSRSRAFLERVANALGFVWLDIVRFENRVTDALEIEESVSQLEQGDVIESRKKRGKTRRYALMGAAAAGGALVIGLSAGLLAPVIGAGLGAALGVVGISGTAGFLTGVGGITMITTTGVLTGANIAGRGMAKRTREVRTFILRPLHNNKRVSCYITVGGFMAGKGDDVRLPFSVLDQIVGDVFSVLWEPEMMAEMGNAIAIISNEVLSSVGQQILAATIAGVLMSALQWPVLLAKLGYLIDNPWSNAMDRAKAAGLVLADVLIERHVGVRPTSLIGFSLGARVIFYALLELSRRGAYGIVQDVYLFGATFTANRQTWLDARSVVGGRFVNGFSTNDWMLGYLLRAATGGLQTVAGLRPVETVPGLENVEVTDLIHGHMSYRTVMPQLLARVGFPVTAEYFDEPDDPDLDPDIQERYIVQDEEEEEQRKQKKILGIFPRKNKGSRNNSGRSTPARKSGDVATSSATPAREADDDDDLPPREDHLPPREEEADLGEMPRASHDPRASGDSPKTSSDVPKISSPDPADEEAAVRHIPKTAGFDFAAIGKVLGKDLDVSKIDHNPTPPAEARSTSPLKVPERTESAPPPSASPASFSHPGAPRSNTANSFHGLPVEDDGDIAIMAQKHAAEKEAAASASLEMPSWDRPAWPVEDKKKAPSVFGFNAWASPASAQSGSYNQMGMRAAPPARPHPPDLMANPFANPFASNGDERSGAGATSRSGQPKRLEDALENPW